MQLDFESVKSNLPLDKMERLVKKDPRNLDDLYAHTGKYVQKIDLYLQEKIDVASTLALDSNIKGKRILDIGTGIGIFPWICKELGHNCLSTYYDKFPLYESIWRLLKIKKPLYLELRANRYWQLDITKKFDLITAQRTVFDRYPSTWTAYNWLMFFLEAERFLKPNGMLFVKTNCSEEERIMDTHAKRLLDPFMLEGFNSTTFLIKREDILGLLGTTR